MNFSTTPISTLLKSLLLPLLLWGMFLCGYLFPEHFWGTHFLAFLPTSVAIGMLILALGAILLPHFISFSFLNKLPEIDLLKNRFTLPVLFSGLFALIFFLFPIETDYYGDAFFIRSNLLGKVEEWDARILEYIFVEDLISVKGGYPFFYGFNDLIAYVLQVEVIHVVEGLGLLMGMGIVGLWSFAIGQKVKNTGRRLILGFMGLGLPFLANYLCHYELYALAIFGQFLFLLLMLHWFRTGRRLHFYGLLLLLLINLRLHVTGFVLILPFLWVCFEMWGRGKPEEDLRDLRKKFSLGLAAFCLLAGSLLYFVVLESAFARRIYAEKNFVEVLFIPLKANEEAPLGMYNLFSGGHLFDYLNQLFFWGAGPLFLLGLLLPARLRRTNSDPALLALLFTFGSQFLVFFTLNPLLGMPRDWDLFSVPAATLLLLILHLLRKTDVAQLPSTTWGAVFGLSLLSLAHLPVNADRGLFSERFRTMARHEFFTYRLDSGSQMSQAIQLNPSLAVQVSLHRDLLLDLRDHAVPGNDEAYATLNYGLGEIYKEIPAQKDSSLYYFLEAKCYSPYLRQNVQALFLWYVGQGNWEAAAPELELLAKMQYPSENWVLRRKVRFFLETNQAELALQAADELLRLEPESPGIQEVSNSLKRGVAPAEAKYLFPPDESWK